MIVIYTSFHSDPVVRGSWNLFDPMIIRSIPIYLEYGVSATIAQLLSWCPYELTVAYGGRLGIIELAGSTVLNGIVCVLSAIPYGITLTVAGMIGFNLGANYPRKAWRYSISAVALGCILSLLI